MENTPVTQEIFAAFMKCLNQYDFTTTPFNFDEKETEQKELAENQHNNAPFITDAERMHAI